MDVMDLLETIITQNKIIISFKLLFIYIKQ
jgi:hypothetical protein